MARLGDHPHIVTVYDAVEDAGALLHRRALHGGRLAGRGSRGARRPAAEVDEVLRSRRDAGRRARARARARRRPPRRQARQHLARADGSAGLGDFGIALSRASTREPGGRDRHAYYIAPEQAAARQPLPAADLYALGATLWRAVRPAAVQAPTRARCSAAPPRPARAAVEARARVPRRSTRSSSRCWPSAPDDPPRRPRCATRSTGWAAHRASPSRGGADRDPLVGRDASWSCCAALEAARRRRARSRVAGEPGIGKSRMVDESVAEAGAARRRGRARPRRRGVARTAWRAALRPLVAAASGLARQVLDDLRRLTGDWIARLPRARPAAPRRRMARRSGCACSTRSPRWSAPSPASARCSSRSRTSTPPIARRSCCSPTCRPGRAGRASARGPHIPHCRAGRPAIRSAPARAAERDRRLTRVPLRGLPRSYRALPPAGRALIGPPRVRALHERTAGNPFFLRELVRLLAERGELGGAAPRLAAGCP